MVPSVYKLRDLEIRPAAILAPMAGVTDTLFRRVIRGLGGCGLLMTEFTSSDGITRSAKKTLRYLYFQEDEHPITAQLFGANPAVMAEAAKMVEDLGFDAVDINLGCPAKKVVKCGGSGLLRDMPLLEDIFKSVRAEVKVPLTIKLRAGWDENSIVAVDVAKLAESVGVEAIAVHPRTRMQGYAGQADWPVVIKPSLGRGGWTGQAKMVRVAEADQPTAVAAGLEVKVGEQRITIQPGVPAVIGRDPGCRVRVPDPLVSRRHAELSYVDGGWVLRDLGSSNGTYVDGQQVQTVRVGAGARVRLGGAGDDGLLVLLGTEAAPPPPARSKQSPRTPRAVGRAAGRCRFRSTPRAPRCRLGA